MKKKKQQHKLLIEINFYDETFVSGSIINVINRSKSECHFIYYTNNHMNARFWVVGYGPKTGRKPHLWTNRDMRPVTGGDSPIKVSL